MLCGAITPNSDIRPRRRLYVAVLSWINPCLVRCKHCIACWLSSLTGTKRKGGPIPTRHRRPARWADSHAAASPGKVGRFPYRHVCSLCYPWIVQLSGSLVVWRSVPRNRPRAAANAQYGAATRRRAAVPARRRAAPTTHPRGGRAAVAWR